MLKVQISPGLTISQIWFCFDYAFFSQQMSPSLFRGRGVVERGQSHIFYRFFSQKGFPKVGEPHQSESSLGWTSLHFCQPPITSPKYLKVPRSTSIWGPQILEQFRAVWNSLEQFGTLRAICRMGWMGLDWLSLNSLPIRSPQSGANKHCIEAMGIS